MPFENLEEETICGVFVDELINLVKCIAEVFFTDFVAFLIVGFVVLFEDLFY